VTDDENILICATQISEGDHIWFKPYCARESFFAPIGDLKNAQATRGSGLGCSEEFSIE
jgi:hypothetical protein